MCNNKKIKNIIKVIECIAKEQKKITDRVGVLQNVCIFFFKFFYIEVFSDPKIDKIKKIWLKKNLFKIRSCYFSLKIQMRIKNKKKGFTKFFFVQLTKCTFKT